MALKNKDSVATPIADQQHAQSPSTIAGKEDWRTDIREAVAVMRRGGVIAYPTDTIWGLGCDATNEAAVRRIFEVKHRKEGQAMIVLIDSPAKLQGLVKDIPEVAWSLMELSEKPLTIVFDGGRNVAQDLLGADGSLGIRVTKEAFSKELCFRMGRAVVSTSANVSGHPAPKRFEDIEQEILNSVDYVCLSRQNESRKVSASSILKLGKDGAVKVIRQ